MPDNDTIEMPDDAAIRLLAEEIVAGALELPDDQDGRLRVVAECYAELVDREPPLVDRRTVRLTHARHPQRPSRPIRSSTQAWISAS